MGQILTLHSPRQAATHYASGVWRNETLYALAAAHADAKPLAFALRDAWRRLTWRELIQEVDRVAADLHQAGLKPGDRVSLWLSSRAETVIVFLACSRNGYVCNSSLHQNYTVAEIEELLQRIGSKAVFLQSGYGADNDKDESLVRVANLPGMRRAVLLGAKGARGEASAPFASYPTQAAAAPRQPAPSTDPDQVVYIAFTSGTTGTPKGVMHSDNTLLANGRAMVADWQYGDKTVLLSLSPMSHHIGTVALEQALVGGYELVTWPQDAGLAAVDWIEATGATYVMGVPTHAMDILAETQRRGATRLGQVKTFYMAGAPIAEKTAKSFLELGINPQNIYGMTENGSHQYTMPGDSTQVITGTCGKACRGYEIALWKPEAPDEPSEPGEVGEIAGRGALLMLGYFGAQNATENSFNAHGWFLSGDLGRFDEQGNLQVVGRKKDLIIRGGHNIHPSRIENLAVQHASVAKAAAFGVPDERLGEKVCLAVLAARDQSVEPEEILAHLHRVGLSKYDMPEYFIALPNFPLTASGKILKRELTEWLRAERFKPTPVRFRIPTQDT